MNRFLRLQSRDIVVAVSIAMFMVQLDATVLVVALPRIAADFGVRTISLSLSITIYLTMLVALLPVSGWAADRFGARRVFSLAILGFAAASALCALCESFWPFIAARALQGAAASLLAPVGRLILLKRTPKNELVDALSITAMPMLIAPTVGPSIGGFIVDYARWEYIFLLNLPFAALLFWIAQARVPRIPAEAARPLDWRGAAMMAGALVCVLTGLDRLTSGFARPAPWLLVGAGAVLAWATWRHLLRHPDPIVSLEPLRVREYATTAIGSGAVVRVPPRALLFVLPLMFQIGFGMSPFAAGLLLMALSGGDLLMKPAVRPLFDRIGFASTILWASGAGIAAMLLLAVVQPGSIAALAVIAAALVVSGISRSLLFTGMVAQSFTALRDAHVSSGNVVASISQQLVNALTVLLCAILLALIAWAQGRAEPALADFRITLAIIAAIGIAATLRLRAFLPASLHDARVEEPSRVAD
ncbi:MFS transporter [Sphingomonas canadensis]|uniref:MFS transporter n=1 Tax=Sphingomonas canadensis TaxID=1219257 RepID=A0ABW3HBR6_9SPHN|nr:MFS transporter [Sphingomonas canadensis]MCW3838327.1 MFS transporter [Sphingomonas canadensis]